MRKRIIALMLSIVMILCLLPAAAAAEQDGWSVIGDICGTMWDTDFLMTEIEPGVWASDPLELHEGEMLKLRFGGSWDQNYGIDPEWDGSGPVTYCANGSNLVIPADETYIITLDLSDPVTITLTNSAGETVTPLTEGDPPAPFDPFPHTWTVIGTIFGTEWDTDFLMTETEPGVWQSAPWALHAGEEFRVRADCDWEVWSYGIESGDNCVVEEDGTYIITLNLNNDPIAVTWELTDLDPEEPVIVQQPDNPDERTWTVIGTIFGTEWDTDFLMTETEPGVWQSAPWALHAGEEFRVRANCDSECGNYGTESGDNCVVGEDGTYIITLNLNNDPVAVTWELTDQDPVEPEPVTPPGEEVWTVIGTIFGTEWDTDFLMTETEPGVWQSAPWALHAGEEFRVRANCDSECGNYGTESGDNCVVGEDGTYIITLNLNNDPVAVTWELTDQDPVEPEPVTPPGEEVWSVIGGICGTSWDTDFTMTEIEPGVWASEPLDLHINDELKVRFGGSWNQNYGIDPDWDGSGPVTYRADGWNLVIPFTDTYIITLYLSDPVTITLTNSAGETVMPLTEGGTPDPPDPFSHTPSVIGSICGTMWDTDFWMTEIETDVWASEPLDLHINDELKVRFGGTWDTNYGIDPDWDGSGPVTYSPDGRNLVIPFTDTYIITLYLSDPVTITLTNAAGETVMPGAEPFDDPDPGDDPGNDPDYPYISDEDIDPATAFNFASDDLEVPDTPPVAPDYDNSLSDLPIDEAHFPDANFREWILRTLDYETSADEETGEESYFFTGEQRWNVTVIDCRGRHIQSLAGIEYFPNLEWLFCGRMLTEYIPEYAFMLYASNPITSLDVSGNPKLKLLFANYCKLESIDLSQNPALTHLNLFYNELTELDLSNNPLLEALAFDVNEISSFDPSVLPNLRILRCGFTALTALDLSGRSELTELRCHNNDMLETLNINGCANLIPTESSIHDCYALKELRMRNCNLREIPINIGNLEILDCGNNTQFTSLDLSDYRELRELYCDNCNLYRLELSTNRKITILNCSYNHLKELQFVLIPGSTPEYGGDFDGIGQTAVCASGMEPEDDAFTFDMANLVASENLGRILSVNGATYDPATGIATFAEAAETLIYSYETQPSGVQYISVPLIVTVSLNVEMPDLPDGAIPIDAEHFPDANFRTWILKTLTPYYTEDAFGRKYLTDTRYDAFYFSMDGWGVASLEGLQYFPNAHSLMCGGGSLQDEDGEWVWHDGCLTEVDFSGNPNLVEVYLNNNQIEEIDVSCLPVLQWLGVKNNRLTELNVEVNYNLAALWCDRNELNLLLLPNPDVHVYGKKDGEQQESRLARLECGDNALPALDLSMQTELKELSCEGNSLTALDLAGNENLGLLDCDDGVAITLPEGVTFCAQMTVNGDEKTYQCTSLAAAIDKITGKDGVTGPEEVQSACITVFENLEGPALIFAADQQKTVVIDLDGHTYWAWDDPPLVAYDNDVTVINGEIVYRPRPAFRTQSLVLSGQIGVTFFLELPEIDGADYTESHMTFSVPNGTVTARDDFDPEAMNANKTYYGFTCYLNTIQMAEPITATFHYPVNGEEKTIEKIYAAKDYFEAYDNNKELFDEKTQAVIESLADYGHYMQAYLKEVKMLDCTDMDKYYTEAYIFSEIEELLNDHPVQYEPNGANIAKISFSTVLDSQTSIRLVLTPTNGYTGTVTAETTDGTPVTVTGTGKRYIVDIPDIPAHKLSTAYTINLATDGGTATICASALSYAKMMMDSSEEAIVRNAASAFFAYSAAADAYRRSH